LFQILISRSCLFNIKRIRLLS